LGEQTQKMPKGKVQRRLGPRGELSLQIVRGWKRDFEMDFAEKVNARKHLISWLDFGGGRWPEVVC